MSEELTSQQVFDEVCRHLIKQGRRSVAENGILCMYRSHDGAKCAVGALIRDDEYVPAMENHGSITDLVDAGLLPERLLEHDGLLRGLQRAHDESKSVDFVAEVSRRLRGLAERRGLSTAVLDEVAP